MELRRELADGGLSLAAVAARNDKPAEIERWQAMADMERCYLERLAAQHWRDPVADQLAQVRHGQRLEHIRHVVLAAMPDPPRLLEQVLDGWANRGGKVTILVAAPPKLAQAFDDWGRPRPTLWEQREVPLEAGDILIAADPDDQAALLAASIREGLDAGNAAKALAPPPGASTAPRHPALAIGTADRETVAPLQRELAGLGLPAFDPQDRLLRDTAVFRLVQSLLDWHERAGYAETATLLRQPDVLAALPDANRVLRELDDRQQQRLPVHFDDLYRAAHDADTAGAAAAYRPPPATALCKALEHLNAWRRALGGSSMADGLRSVLQAIFAHRELSPNVPADTLLRDAIEAIDAALRELAELEADTPGNVDAGALLPARLQGVTLKAERDGELLDLEGWLELAWNPAPVLCVAGMNEGFVPDSHVGDLFLPDSLRTLLGLRDDRLRVARDAYLLSALCAQRTRPDNSSGEGRIILLVGKRSTSGDPLRPSRLLFRCPDSQLAQRARTLFANPAPTHTAVAHAIDFKLNPWRVTPPTPTDTRFARISPSTLKAYLRCPFRFYLGQVLRMEARDDRAREPDARAFGELCHAVLEDMANDPACVWADDDPESLAQWLEARLFARAHARYGERPWLGVTLAVDTAARRLRAFAAQQVAWRRQGWSIFASESTGSHHHQTVQLAGATLHGRIDRIDRHADGRYCILDYKTGDRAETPDSSHLASANGDFSALPPEALLPEALPVPSEGRRRSGPKRWTDLQLPIYREIVRGTLGPDLLVGYIRLPASPGDTGFALWEGYSDALHAAALDCAAAVIQRIRQGVYWPPIDGVPRYDDFRDLLLDDPQRTCLPPPATRADA